MNNIFFPSKYPIVEAIMNPVSDLKLALAVADSGGYPSLFNDGNSEKLNFLLSEFKKSIGNTNIVVCTHIQSKDIIGFIKVIKKHKPSHCEIFCVDENGQKNNSILTDDKISRLNLEMINYLILTFLIQKMLKDLQPHLYFLLLNLSKLLPLSHSPLKAVRNILYQTRRSQSILPASNSFIALGETSCFPTKSRTFFPN